MAFRSAPGDYGIVRLERLIILAMRVEQEIADAEASELVTDSYRY
jgi:hypothetical protein